MNINHITTSEAITKGGDPSALVRNSKPSSDSTDFAGYKNLQAALKNQSDIRQEKMSDVLTRTSSPIYPPQELIQGISKLIAEEMIESKYLH